MRNYLKIWRNTATIQIPDLPATIFVEEFGLDEEDVRSQAAADIAYYTGYYGQFYNDVTGDFSEPYANWLEVDREMILRVCAHYFRKFPTSYPSINDSEDFSERIVSESPKKTWSNGH